LDPEKGAEGLQTKDKEKGEEEPDGP